MMHASPWNSADVPLMGPRATAQRLGIAAPQGDRVVRSGIAGTVYATTAGPLVEAAEVDRLAARPLVKREALPPALVLRSGSPNWTDDRWTGWHATMTTAEVHEAALRWWPIARPEDLPGELVVIAIAGIPGWTGRITEARREYGRVAISASPTNDADDAASIYMGSRLDLPRGPLIDRIGV